MRFDDLNPELPSFSVSANFQFKYLSGLVLSITVGFWIFLLLPQHWEVVLVLRAILGIFVFAFIPGALLALILNIQPSSSWSHAKSYGYLKLPGTSNIISLYEFLLFSAGLSLLVVSGLTVVAGLLFPAFGFTNPLSPLSISALTTGSTLILLFAANYYECTQFDYNIQIGMVSPVFSVYLILPVLSAAAAGIMNVYNNNILMYAFVLLTVGGVALLFTRYVSSGLYSGALFSISISTLFHRNLITHHVLGADIQFIYFVSDLIKQMRIWSPNIGGELLALPVVTSYPAALSLATGVDLSLVFKVVFVIVFSLTPVGIFHLYRYIFDDEVGIFASLLFLFYHITFYFTPDKQLMAELYVVILLLIIVKHNAGGTKSKIATTLAIVGIVFSHHGVAYVFGFAMLASSVFIWIVNRYLRDIRSHFSIYHSIGVILSATLWYGFVSPDLLIRIISTPLDALLEIQYLLTGEITQVGGSGESFVTQLALSPEIGTLLTYFLITFFTLFGVGWLTLSSLTERLQTLTDEQISLTALAFPLSAFLVSSYFLPISLWADRVYQMVLPVLCPFLVLGYRVVATGHEDYSFRVPSAKVAISVLVCLLFLFNSGFVFALTGAPTDPTFSSDAHDLAFSGAEYESGIWLKTHEDIHRVDFREAYPSVTTPNGSSENETRIYVDQYTYQIYRSTIPSEYYNIQYIYTKSEWRSNVTGENISSGYVIVRDNSIVSADTASDLPPYYLTTNEVGNISKEGDLIYDNEDITIYEFNAST